MERHTVTYDDVRQFLAARTCIPSNLGSQLDRMRDGMSGGASDAKRVQERDEVRRLRLACIIRCVDDLTDYASIRFAWAPDLRRVASRIKMKDGEAVVRVLYAYEAWGSQWPEKGLVEVYSWLRSMEPKRYRPIAGDGVLEAQAFREGRSRDARRVSSSVVADAHVVLSEWTRIWSRRASNDNGNRSAA